MSNIIEARAINGQFHRKAEQLINKFQDLIRIVPQKGNKAEDCQRTTLQKALNNLDAAINGTSHSDFWEDLPHKP